MRQVKKRELADRLEDTSHSILDAIPEKIDSASLNQLAIALGVSIDKRLLLLGQPNSIQAGVYLTQEQRVKRLDEIFARHLPAPQQTPGNGDQSTKCEKTAGAIELNPDNPDND